MSTPISYDSNGYINSWETLPDMNAPNPWSAMAQADQGNVNAAGNAASNIPQAQMRLSGQVDQMNKYGMSTQAPQTGYPALPNDYGLGNTSNNSSPDNTSHGFNPWSLKGEALSR